MKLYKSNLLLNSLDFGAEFLVSSSHPSGGKLGSERGLRGERVLRRAVGIKDKPWEVFLQDGTLLQETQLAIL